MKKGLIFSGIMIAVVVVIMISVKTSKKEEVRELKYNRTNSYLVLPGQKVYVRDDYINFPRYDSDGAYRYFEFVYLGRSGNSIKIFLRESGYGNFVPETRKDEFKLLGERFLWVSGDCAIAPIIGDSISLHFGVAPNGGIYVFSRECSLELEPPSHPERNYEVWRRENNFGLKDRMLASGP